MKKTSLILTFTLVLFIIPFTVSAFELETRALITLPEDETVEGNYYAIGDIITIDGDINGDIFVAGENVTINGNISGDIFAAVSENFVLNNKIGSSLRVIGTNITINNKIPHSAHLVGENITIAKIAEITGDLFVLGANINHMGKVGGDLHGMGSLITIAGEVGKDVKLRLDDKIKESTHGWKFKMGGNNILTVTESATINGNLYYSASQEGLISKDAEIKGEIGYSAPKPKSTQANVWNLAWGALFGIFSSFVIGLVLITLWRERIKKLTDVMLVAVWPSIGWGLILMFLTPFIILLLLFTIIGIPLAVILGVIWLIAMYISKTIVGILIGRMVLNKIWEKKKDSLIWAMIIGVSLVWLLTKLPLIGWLLSLVAIWWALGGMWQMRKKM